MSFHEAMMHDTVWFDRPKYEQEVENYQLFLSGHAVATATASTTTTSDSGSTLVNQIKEARSQIQRSLSPAPAARSQPVANQQVQALEKENQDLKKLVADLTTRLAALEVRVGKVEASGKSAPAPAAADSDSDDPFADPKPKAAAKKPAAKKPKSDSDDPFGGSDSDDDDDDETPAQKAHREKMQALSKKKADDKKAKEKKVVVGKSEVTLDVKPWDDETDMKALEASVRTVAMEGLIWGAGKLVPVGYGINKLRIMAVVVDDLVSVDDIQEQIESFDDYVQSTDIAAFNKI